MAVCGLAGGAGATTLAYLIALAAARQGAGPVLVADGGGPSGALAMLAGVQTPRSLPVVAYELEAGRSIRGGVCATGPAGVRVVASGPEFEPGSAGEQLTCLLLDAREAHALAVIDCGTLGREVELTMARVATHLVWVTAATAHGLACARRVLAAAPSLAGKQIVVGRADARQAKASLRELRRIATDRQRTARPPPPLARVGGPQAGQGTRGSAGATAGDPRSAPAMTSSAARTRGPRPRSRRRLLALSSATAPPTPTRCR